MKRIALFGLLTTLTLSSLTSAQTRIGTVTLTKPGQPAHQPIVTPNRSAIQGSQSSASTSSTIAVPSGWYEVQGKISAPKATLLPSGSTVHVYLEDASSKPAKQMLHISFGTSRLPTNYQMVFNPSRLNAAHQYTVRATITDASGKQIYSSSAQNFAKGSHNIDLSVR